MASFLLNRSGSAGGRVRLEDQVFCATQERDFFRSRYLEQVSEISQMKKDLERARKEISRLRQEVLGSDSMLNRSIVVVEAAAAEREEATGPEVRLQDSKESDESSSSEQSNEEDKHDDEHDDGEDEATDIRNNAAKLLHWANYRTSMSPTKVLSGASSLRADDDSTTLVDDGDSTERADSCSSQLE